MDLNEFNENYLDPLMEKLSLENKKIFLMGDFNIDLLKVDLDCNTTTFFDNMTSNLFVPHLILPTRITLTTKKLLLIISILTYPISLMQFQVILL